MSIDRKLDLSDKMSGEKLELLGSSNDTTSLTWRVRNVALEGLMDINLNNGAEIDSYRKRQSESLKHLKDHGFLKENEIDAALDYNVRSIARRDYEKVFDVIRGNGHPKWVKGFANSLDHLLQSLNITSDQDDVESSPYPLVNVSTPEYLAYAINNGDFSKDEKDLIYIGGKDDTDTIVKKHYNDNLIPELREKFLTPLPKRKMKASLQPDPLCSCDCDH